MLNIKKEIINDIINTSSLSIAKKYEIDGINYYIKKDNDLREVIGSRLAKLMNLLAINYDRIIIKDFNYAISKDINNEYEFYLAENFVNNNSNLFEIINSVIGTLGDKGLIIDIIKMYLYDILFLNYDRDNRNWGFIKENNKYRLIIFDNQGIFSIFAPPFINYNPELFKNNKGFFISFIYQDFEQFLDYCPDEYLGEIEKIINSVSYENINLLFLNLEKELDIKINPTFLMIYKDHYKRINDIIKNRGVSNAR